MAGLRSAAALAWRRWPWRRAGEIGGAVLVGWLAFSVAGGELGGIYVASPVSLGLFAFFLVGGLMLVLGPGAHDPWRVAVAPALATAVTIALARRALTLWGLEESLGSSLVDALARGAIVLAILGVAGSLAGRPER